MRVERVPIRTAVHLTPGGERRRTLSVYCPFQGRTFPAQVCHDCARLVTWAKDADACGAHVVCASDAEPPEMRVLAMRFGDRAAGSFEEVGAHTPIGLVMAATFTTAHADLEIEELRQHIGASTGRVLPVVDDDGAL